MQSFCISLVEFAVGRFADPVGRLFHRLYLFLWAFARIGCRLDGLASHCDFAQSDLGYVCVCYDSNCYHCRAIVSSPVETKELVMPVLPPKVLHFLDIVHLRIPIRTVAFGVESCLRRLRAPIIRRQIARLVETKRSEIRASGRKIRVCFVCHDKSTWIYQSVYDAMRKDADFEPYVLAVNTWVRNNEQGARQDLVSFFRDRGMSVHTELRACALPDVMLLPRFDEFAFQGVFKIRELYREVLFAGQIYAWITHNCDAYYFGNDDLTYLWKYFMFNDRDAGLCIRMKKLSHKDVVTVGFARNDEFAKAGQDGQAYWKQDASYKIVWAPHWSVLTHGRFGRYRF